MVFQVRAQAVRAVCSFIIAHERETALQKQFQGLLPNMLQVNEPAVWFRMSLDVTCVVKLIFHLGSSRKYAIR